MKGFDFINGSLIKVKKFNMTDDTAVKVLAVSTFLPYPVTFAAVAIFFVIIMLSKRARSVTFTRATAILLSVFSALGVGVSVIYRNWVGLAALVGMVCIMVIGQYLQAVMTKRSFDSAVDIICSLAPVTAVVTAVEFIVRHYFCGVPSQDIVYEFRCSGFYFYPNYLGTVSAIIATPCIYRFVSNREHRARYVFSGICCIVCIILSGSMFACVEFAVSALVMIIFCKRWKYLSILTAGLIAAGITVIIVPELIPRLDQANGTFLNRVNVWQVSAEAFRQTPLFGRGLLTYYHIFLTDGNVAGINMYPTEHAHNLLLDSLLNFGVIGTAALICYFICAWRRAVPALKSRVYTDEAALSVGVAAGALVHGMVDLTLLWVQSGLLFIIVISCWGFISRNSRPAQ